MGVGNGAGGFRMARMTSKDSGGRTHQVAVPFERELNLRIGSTVFKLNKLSDDARGRLPSFSAIPIAAPRGTSPVIWLTVSGVGR